MHRIPSSSNTTSSYSESSPSPTSPRAALRAPRPPVELPPSRGAAASFRQYASDAMFYGPTESIVGVGKAVTTVGRAGMRAGKVALALADDVIKTSMGAPVLPDQPPRAAAPERPQGLTWLQEMRGKRDHLDKLATRDTNLMYDISQGVRDTARYVLAETEKSISERLWLMDEIKIEMEFGILIPLRQDILPHLSEASSVASPSGASLDVHLQSFKTKLAEIMDACRQKLLHEEASEYRNLYNDVEKLWKMVYNLRASDEVTALLAAQGRERAQDIVLVP